MGVDEHTIAVAGASVFYRRAPARDTEVLYLHSVPTSSDDWLALLELTGGLAPDLPGFGRTDKAGNLDYSLPAYVLFVEQFLDALEVGEVVLVGHGWGAAIGLLFAQRHPDRVTRLAIIDAVPLLEGFEWPAIVRWTPAPGPRRAAHGIGEPLAVGADPARGRRHARGLARRPRGRGVGTIRPGHAAGDPAAAPLRRHRDAGRVRCRTSRSLEQPALVLWGEQDPWLPPSFADAYAQRLPHATVERVAGAGHWPWLDEPALAERLAGFAA